MAGMYDVAIVGCGITGAALAYELSKYQVKTVVLERGNDVAYATTRANSAIVHAGYDPEPGTMMARLNVRGNALIEQLAQTLDVPYQKIGSFVLALQPEDQETLRALYNRGVQNGVPELRLLSREEALAMEPALSPDVLGALYAPSAGIVSPWELCLALMEAAVQNGAELRLMHEVTGVEKTEEGYALQTPQGPVHSRFVVNAAGVDAAKVHAMAAPADFTIAPSRGEYYLLDKNQGQLVSRVIFQCPSKVGKGVLVAPTVHGNLIVGPNAEPVEQGHDTATTGQGLDFVRQQALKSVPGVNFRESIRNFAGVRANSDCDDFIIREAPGAPGFIDLAGIKSPGLTSAPAIAEEAVALLQGCGLALLPNEEFRAYRRKIRFKELPVEEKQALIRRDPRFGRVICRCETITEGEIVSALHSPIPPTTLDGVKRRCNAGMGRCQGGFCSPRVQEILSRELGLPMEQVLLGDLGTVILTGRTKSDKQGGLA